MGALRVTFSTVASIHLFHICFVVWARRRILERCDPVAVGFLQCSLNAFLFLSMILCDDRKVRLRASFMLCYSLVMLSVVSVYVYSYFGCVCVCLCRRCLANVKCQFARGILCNIGMSVDT